MADGKFSMQNYIDVAERIDNFNTKYPEGSLQTLSWDVKEVGGRTFIVYRAAAYRTPDDARPGHGIAWEPFPGGTPYTKDSELMNAETAAWGRAIVACGLTSNRKIATKQDVQARQPAEQQQPKTNGQAYVNPEDISAIKNAAKGLTVRQIKLALGSIGASFPESGELFSMVPVDKAAQLAKVLAGTARVEGEL